MIRLLILIIIFLFLIWAVFTLFFGNKKDLNKKMGFSKSFVFLSILVGALIIFWLLPRLGLNPLLLIQKLLPVLSFIRGIIPF